MSLSQYEKEMIDLYKRSLGEKQDFKGLVCPGTHKKPCRLCELCKEILFKKLPKEDPLRQLASKLNAKFRYYSNIIFVADPTEIVVLEYGDKIFKQLLAMQMDETAGWQNFMHPMTGRNLIIDRVQGATKEQVDYFVKPRDPSKLTNMDVLNKLISEPKYNLTNIIKSIEDGNVKPLYQSKLDKRVEIRVLPSWLGPDYSFKFFEKVDYHYNLSEEEFKATLAGEINPVRLGGTVGEKTKPATEWKPIGTEPIYEKANVARSVTPIPQTNPWGIPIKEEKKVEIVEQPVDDMDFPTCYGEFDKEDPNCVTKCRAEGGWADGCKAYHDEKIAKRLAAKRLSK